MLDVVTTYEIAKNIQTFLNVNGYCQKYINKHLYKIKITECFIKFIISLFYLKISIGAS